MFGNRSDAGQGYFRGGNDKVGAVMLAQGKYIQTGLVGHARFRDEFLHSEEGCAGAAAHPFRSDFSE